MNIRNSNRQNKLLLIKMYSLYWLGYILLFSVIQSIPTGDFITVLRNEFYSLLPKIIFVTIVVELMMPRLLFKKKYVVFAFGYIGMILFFAFVQRIIDNYIIIRYYLTFWKAESLFSVPVYLYNISKLQFVVSIPVACRLFYYLAEEKNKVQAIMSEKLQAELSALRNQFHPHFLFNVLNGLYSKILNQSNDSAEIVLKISDLLRFSLYEADRKNIPLSSEIDHLTNYIALQRLRFGHDLQISFSVYGENKDAVIEPFLILPFIENSYKHCLNETNKGWITIAITVNEEWLVVKIENSLSGNTDSKIKNAEGIGLANVKRRLELLYPHRHVLQIKRDDSSFFVSLKLKIKDDKN